MSKIDDLIKKLCPNGVTHCRLGDVIQLKKGKQLNKNFLNEKGQYPAYNGGITFSGYTDTYNYNENTIIISQGGASAGFVNFVKTKFYANAHCYVILPNEEVIINKYVFYFLKLNQKKLTEKQHGAGIPALSTKEILEISIPVPPLSIQNEIVNILNNFTVLTEELEEELDIRKQQFSYYRDYLFSFEGKEVEWKTLGDIGEFVRGNGLQKTDFTEKGVGCIHYGQIYTYYGTSTEETKSFVSHELAKKLKKASKGDLIITNTSENIEDVCKAVVWMGDEEIVTGGHATIYKHNENPKYIAYYTQTNKFYIEKKKYAQGAKVTDVSAKNLAKILIPLPPLNVQNKIVNFLEKLDFLINDKSWGLPAEINAREKQSEYYRNQLLTFKNVSDE
jgi:type I restriction enzyme S subunit